MEKWKKDARKEAMGCWGVKDFSQNGLQTLV